jgi:hypothetical protein
MGSSQSKTEPQTKPIIRSSVRDNKFIRTVIHAAKFRFSFHMNATHRDAAQLMEKWEEFVNDHDATAVFNYKTVTTNPQHIHCEKEGDKVLLTVSTTITLSSEDVQNMTHMFELSSDLAHKHAVKLTEETTIKPTLHRTQNSVTSFGSSASLNLLGEPSPRV